MTWLLSLPSAFWTYLAQGIKSLVAFLSGAVVTKLWDQVKDSQKMIEQYNEILQEERRAKSRPTDGAARRLRASGYTKK